MHEEEISTGFINFINRILNRSPTKTGQTYEMITTDGKFFAWDGQLFTSDIVMAAIRPKVNAIGKTVPKHILEKTVMRDGIQTRDIQVNPEPYIRLLLQQPNQYQTMQKFLEWMATMETLNNHAFALITRDENGLPTGLFPINANFAREKFDAHGNMSIEFFMPKGQRFEFAYEDLLHIYGDSTGGQFWGGSRADLLKPLMEQVTTIDQGVVKAIKNGAIIKWLLKFTSSMRPEDLTKNAQDFAKQFLDTSTGFGVAATDSKAEAKQIEPHDYVPDTGYSRDLVERTYAALNTNKKIVTSDYNEDEWNAYYEAQVEPDVIQIQDKLTIALFSRKKRAYGNYIVLESSNLATASMKTKLNLREMVDRGAMSPNEWRRVLNYAPRPGGDEFVRRLDTAPVNEKEVKDDEES